MQEILKHLSIQPETVGEELSQISQLTLKALIAEAACLEEAAKVRVFEDEWQNKRQEAVLNDSRQLIYLSVTRKLKVAIVWRLTKTFKLK